MYSSKVKSPISVSHFEFLPSRSRDSNPLGQVTFLVNGFIWFRRIPVSRTPEDGLRVHFPDVDPTGSGLPFLREDVLSMIESRVLSALEIELA